MDAYGAACDFIENELGRHNYATNWKNLKDRNQVVTTWMTDTGRAYRPEDVIAHIEGLVKANKPWIG
jgi:hypothetical protein